MKEQFGTITVREAYLSRKEVEEMLHETLFYRGPREYEFDYANPVFIWDRDGGLTIRWPSRDLRIEAGRAPSSLRLQPLAQFIEQEAKKLEKAKPKPPVRDPPPGDASGISKP